MRDDGSKFTINKYYQRNGNQIIIHKKFCVNFCHFTKRSSFRILTSSGGYWKKPTAKTGLFALRMKGEIKQLMVKAAKPFHQATEN